MRGPIARSALCAIAMLGAVSTPAAAAEEPHVATLVTVPTPPGVTRAQIEAGFKQAVPVYERIPGLIRKYFTVNGDSFGGMYLWSSRAAAEKWYSEAFQAQCRQRYGSPCQVTYFDTPIQIDGAAARK